MSRQSAFLSLTDLSFLPHLSLPPHVFFCARVAGFNNLHTDHEHSFILEKEKSTEDRIPIVALLGTLLASRGPSTCPGLFQPLQGRETPSGQGV